jgi:hypothetical protein
MYEARSRLRWYIATLLDRAVAPAVNPAHTLVLSGFWRSGTTWLQELLAGWLRAKTIFEPFHLYVPDTQKLFADYGVAAQSPEFHELWFPYWDAADPQGHAPLRAYYRRALRGQVAGRAARAVRGGVAESFRRRLIVKFTRGAFSLGAAQAAFGFPLIHIHRDPRAVIASIRLTDWEWVFQHLSLQAQLLEGRDGRAGYFSRWEAAIREFDVPDVVTRVAAYWAIAECALAQAQGVSLRYEETLADPAGTLAPALETLGVPAGRLPDGAGRDSYSTSAGRRGASAQARISGWRETLRREEQARIEAVARAFGLENRLTAD